MKIKITSIARHLSERCVSSETLDVQLGLTKGSIEASTGVRQRHWLQPTEMVSDMAAAALQKALDQASLTPASLDLLISAGAAFDYPVPHNSVIIKSRITNDEVDFPCMDIDTTCLSFLNAMETAHAFLLSGKYKRIALVCSELASRALTSEDPKTYGLFGDAAVAMILEGSEMEGYTPVFEKFVNFPSGALYAKLGIGGAINRGQEAPADHRHYFFEMDGTRLIRLTLQHLEPFIRNMESKTTLVFNELDHIVAHQTSKFGNDYLIHHFNLDASKVVNTLTEYGNCISASIPLGLEALVKEHDLRGKNVLLLGSGAGLSLGGILLRF